MAKKNRSLYVGKAGHLAVMSELALRGYNVAMPEMDIGDDIFAVNDATAKMWRIQVKTATVKKEKANPPQTPPPRVVRPVKRRFQFRIKVTAITDAPRRDSCFVFVMRAARRWRYCIIRGSKLEDRYRDKQLGSENKGHVQLWLTLDGDSLRAGGLDLSRHLDSWDDVFPRI